MKIRSGTPSRRSATPSAFQKPVAAATLPAASEETALKPIVTSSTAGRVAAGGAHLGVDDGFVGGQPGDPDGASLEVARAADALVAAGEHRGQRPLHDRHQPDQVEAALAGDAEVVDVEDREVGAAGGEQLRRVGRFAGLVDLQVDSRVGVEALAPRGVDPGVDRVGREIEDQARASRRARFSAAPAAAGDAGEQQSGRQQRDSPSHLAAGSYSIKQMWVDCRRLPESRIEEEKACRREDFPHIWLS